VNVTRYVPGRRYDPVLARVVGDDRPDLLDERRTRRLHGDTRQHRAGWILDHAGDGGLRECRRGNEHEQQNRRRPPGECTHGVPPQWDVSSGVQECAGSQERSAVKALHRIQCNAVKALHQMQCNAVKALHQMQCGIMRQKSSERAIAVIAAGPR
jgi:hypothetical protein